MPRVRQIATAVLAAGAALLVAAGKPAPTPVSFYPALSYRYSVTDIRLSNADGSQAVLLVRMPLGPNSGVSILRHALAPLGKQQAAFVYQPVPGTNEVRLVDWTQPTPGGPLSVALSPTPLFVRTGTGVEITSVDYSPDGNQIAIVSWVQGKNQELRFFDVNTRTQIGDAIPLAQDGSNAHWRPFDGSLLMRGGFIGFSTYKDGVQLPLFNTGNGGYFDVFNSAATDVIIQSLTGGENYLQRWDGATLNNGAPLLTTLTVGYHPSVSCDNSRMIFQRGSRAKTILYAFGSGTETALSQDGSVSQLTYPNSCA